jgi:hypothetical protein
MPWLAINRVRRTPRAYSRGTSTGPLLELELSSATAVLEVSAGDELLEDSASAPPVLPLEVVPSPTPTASSPQAVSIAEANTITARRAGPIGGLYVAARADTTAEGRTPGRVERLGGSNTWEGRTPGFLLVLATLEPIVGPLRERRGVPM